MRERYQGREGVGVSLQTPVLTPNLTPVLTPTPIPTPFRTLGGGSCVGRLRGTVSASGKREWKVERESALGLRDEEGGGISMASLPRTWVD